MCMCLPASVCMRVCVVHLCCLVSDGLGFRVHNGHFLRGDVGLLGGEGVGYGHHLGLHHRRLRGRERPGGGGIDCEVRREEDRGIDQVEEGGKWNRKEIWRRRDMGRE